MKNISRRHCRSSRSLLYDYDNYYYCNRYYPIIVTIIIIVIKYYQQALLSFWRVAVRSDDTEI